MSKRIAITGGQVVTGDNLLDADVVVEGDKIVALTAHGQAVAVDREIDASGCYVFPGIIDAHTHIQLDTGIYKTADNWEIGTRAAAFGGVTTVIDFANQIPGRPFSEVLAARRAEAQDAVIDYSFHMVVLEPDRDSDQLKADLRGLLELGLPSIKLFTTYRPNYYLNDAQLLHIFRAMPSEMIAMVHCENDAIVTDATQRLVDQGKTGWEYHGQSRPWEAEVEAVSRILNLAASTSMQGRVYIAHCSVDGSVLAVKRSKNDPLWKNAYCETCPQYLFFSASKYRSDRPEHYILQPPLREGDQAMVRYLHNDMVDVVSTDTCDYSLAQKEELADFTRTPGGLPGVETLLSLMYTLFCESPDTSQRFPKPSAISKLPIWIKRMTENPAKLFGLYPRKGTIQPGSDADLVIYDPEPRVTIRHEDLHYVAGYSPYEGMEVQGKVRTVLSRGEVIVDDGEFLGQAGRGQFLHAGPSVDLRQGE